MHRKALLEALAEELLPGTIRFSSKLASIATEKAQGSPEIAVLRLDDATVIRSKVHQWPPHMSHVKISYSTNFFLPRMTIISWFACSLI